jgi:hypothetical protein
MDMMKKDDKKVAPGWYIPMEVREAFTAFCNLKGTVIQEDFAGALTVWRHLPAEIRELAKLEAKGLHPPEEQFWADFEAGLRLGIRAQQASQPPPELGR